MRPAGSSVPTGWVAGTPPGSPIRSGGQSARRRRRRAASSPAPDRLSAVEPRRWLNRSHPQTLLSATMLLYIEGLFSLVRGEVQLLIGVAMFPAAWAIANDRRWGWRLGIAAAVLNVLLPLQWYGLGRPMSLAFALLFPVVLLVLLVHPVSREHQRIWFE